MRKTFALLACSLLASLPLSAAIIRVQTVISKFVDGGRTELVSAPTLTTFGGQPAKIAIGGLELSLTAVNDDKNVITINARLAEKTPDGKSQLLEDFPAITTPNGQKSSVRTARYQIDFTATLNEYPSLTVDFPGGTLSELLTSLPKSGSIVFNLVGEKDDLATALPPLSLRLTSADALAGALNELLNRRGLAILPSKTAPSDYGRTTIFALQKVAEPDAHQSPDALRFRSYQLGDYLTEKQTVEEITQAMRSAWELVPANAPEKLVLKFHPGTSLLLVSGPEDAIRIVENIIASLRPKLRSSTASLTDEVRRLESVADEVRRRRALRQAATVDGLPAEFETPPATPSTQPSPLPPSSSSGTREASPAETRLRLEKVTAEIEHRRALRNALPEGKPTATPIPTAPSPASK